MQPTNQNLITQGQPAEDTPVDVLLYYYFSIHLFTDTVISAVSDIQTALFGVQGGTGQLTEYMTPRPAGAPSYSRGFFRNTAYDPSRRGVLSFRVNCDGRDTMGPWQTDVTIPLKEL